MKPYVDFQDALFSGEDIKVSLDDLEVSFLVSQIALFIELRPLQFDRAAQLCKCWYHRAGFKNELRRQLFFKCPVLFYKLLIDGVFDINEIMEYYQRESHYSIILYQDIIPDYSSFVKKIMGSGSADYLLKKKRKEKFLFGFHPSSVEYCLKYDDIESLKLHFENPSFSISNELKWNRYEWSQKPLSMDILSFAGHYGSINCFKYLLMVGCEVTVSVLNSLLCSGSIELFSLIDFSRFSIDMKYAFMFMQTGIIEWMSSKNGGESYNFLACGYFRNLVYCIENHIQKIHVNEYATPPLHYFTQNKCSKIVKYLLENGENPNELDWHIKKSIMLIHHFIIRPWMGVLILLLFFLQTMLMSMLRDVMNLLNS